MEGYIGGHIDDIDFPGGGQAPSSVTVLLRDPPCTSYFRLPHDRVAEWYGGASGDKRGYYEVVRGPCRLVVEVAGGTPVERHACAAHIERLLLHGPVHHLSTATRSRLVFPATAFPSLAAQSPYVAAALVARLPPAFRSLVDLAVYDAEDGTIPLWPVPDGRTLLTHRAPLPAALWRPPPADTAVAEQRRAPASRKSAMVDSIGAYLAFALEGSRPQPRVGHSAVFFTLAARSVACPRKGGAHRNNRACFVFSPASMRGYFQCMDTACGEGGTRFRWDERCYCVEATGARCRWCAPPPHG